MERKLATIRKILKIEPIKNADSIEVAIVDAWKVVIKKDDFKEDDLVIYCEIDSFLPIKHEFEFLRKSSYKKMSNGEEGFRLRTIKLRGQISQGLILPLSILSNEINSRVLNNQSNFFQEGDDVTDLLKIIKYEPPIPAELAGKVKGNFPSFIPKTDEERIQNLSEVYNEFKKHKYYITEKLDGSSATYYFNNGNFGVCSRNLELLETENNSFWKVARQLDLENKLREFYNKHGLPIMLQGELIGEGVQGNPYKIKGQTVKFFNMFDIGSQLYFGLNEFKEEMNKMELEIVPIIDENFELPENVDELIKTSDGTSQLNNNVNREGIVVRNLTRIISFKVISNEFLLKEK